TAGYLENMQTPTIPGDYNTDKISGGNAATTYTYCPSEDHFSTAKSLASRAGRCNYIQDYTTNKLFHKSYTKKPDIINIKNLDNGKATTLGVLGFVAAD